MRDVSQTEVVSVAANIRVLSSSRKAFKVRREELENSRHLRNDFLLLEFLVV